MPPRLLLGCIVLDGFEVQLQRLPNVGLSIFPGIAVTDAAGPGWKAGSVPAFVAGRQDNFQFHGFWPQAP